MRERAAPTWTWSSSRDAGHPYPLGQQREHLGERLLEDLVHGVVVVEVAAVGLVARAAEREHVREEASARSKLMCALRPRIACCTGSVCGEPFTPSATAHAAMRSGSPGEGAAQRRQVQLAEAAREPGDELRLHEQRPGPPRGIESRTRRVTTA